uniref:Uncharacterized protein n=1 Tax=Glossina brevipalpis TaxID=37001 RepID=A0A1A9WXM4_9MUSC
MFPYASKRLMQENADEYSRSISLNVSFVSYVMKTFIIGLVIFVTNNASYYVLSARGRCYSHRLSSTYADSKINSKENGSHISIKQLKLLGFELHFKERQWFALLNGNQRKRAKVVEGNLSLKEKGKKCKNFALELWWIGKHGVLKPNFVTSPGPVPELRHRMRECNLEA